MTEADVELGYQYLEDAVKLGSEEAKEDIDYINSSHFEARERKKEEPATPVAPFWQDVAAMFWDAVAADLREIIGRIGDERIYTVALVTDRAMVSAMKQVKDSGILEARTEEITFFISISDDGDAENLKDSSAMTLNPPELAAAFLSRSR